MRYRFILIIVSLFSALSLFGQNIEIDGYARSYIGVLTNDTHDYSILQNTFDLKFHKGLSKAGFFANPYVYQYPNQNINIDLREAYVDLYFDNMDLRIGKQQIIWGKADGVFITDLVSPKDLSEFLLRDFEEIRTGITSIKADYYFGNNTVECVWIPVFVPTKMPDESSRWSRIPTFLIPTQTDYSMKDIPENTDESEIFFKYSGMTSALDYEVLAGSFYEDDPTIHIEKKVDPVAGTPFLQLTPQHHRLNMIGGSFSTDIKGKVFRGEGAYYTGKVFPAMDSYDIPTLTLDKDYLYYLLGFDFNIGETKMSTQFIQKAILDYESSIVAEEFDNTITFLMSRNCLRETLTAQLFTYIGLNNSDALIRPSLSYDFSDGFEISLGANLFYRNETSVEPDISEMFGYFDTNDMFYTKVKFSF
jgi:hypothetical protein